APDHALASDDCLDTIFGGAFARQDPLTGETKGDNLPTATRIGLVLCENSAADEHHFIAWGAGFAERPPRFDLNDLVRHFGEEVSISLIETRGDQRLTQGRTCHRRTTTR